MPNLPNRVLGNTNFRISEIGFGAWAIGADWGTEVPEDQAREALHAAIDAGMNFIDTADIYGGEHCLPGILYGFLRQGAFGSGKKSCWPLSTWKVTPLPLISQIWSGPITLDVGNSALFAR